MKKIGLERTVFLFGEINEQNVLQAIVKIIGLWEKEKSPINLAVSSNGGSLSEMFATYDAILSLAKVKMLRTTALGNVASAAVLLFMMGEERVMGKCSKIFLHQFGKTYDGVRLETDDLREKHSTLKKLENLYAGIISSKSKKISKKKILEMMRKETNMYPVQAVRFGLAHKIL